GCGIKRKCNGGLAFIHQPLQLSRSSHAANKINPFVRANVPDSEYRFQQSILKKADVKICHRAFTLSSVVRKGQSIPALIEVHADMPSFRRVRRSILFHFKVLSESTQKLLLLHSIKIAHDPVVRKNTYLFIRKDNRQEEVVFLVTSMSKALLL